MNSMIMDTKMNTVQIEPGKTKEQVVDEALALFNSGQSIICLSVQLNYSNNMKAIVEQLEGKHDCQIVDVFEDNGYLLYFIDSPFLSYK
jgi:hypothetical protein